MKNRWLNTVIAIAVATGLSAFTTVVRAEEMHAPLHHAIHEVEAAVSFMQEAPHDFAHHREAAIRDCRAVIVQLRECLEIEHAGGFKVGVWELPEKHPMRRAILALEEARTHLQHAEHDFHGHRERALQLCDAAIHQLRLALEHV